METKAIIFDLDNTLYPSASIADELFAPVYKIIGRDDAEVKDLMQRKPFQDIAEKLGLSDEVTSQATEVLSNLTWNGDIQPYNGFEEVLALPQRKFLVTAGFTKLQYSKLEALALSAHFEAMYIIDPEVSDAAKKDRFIEILEATGLRPEEVLAVGDDYDSEINAGLELGMRVVLFDSLGLFRDKEVPRIDNLSELVQHL